MLTNLEALRLLFLITYANSVAVPVTDSGDHQSTTLSPIISTHGQHDVYTTEGAWITHNSESPAKHSDNDVYTETTPSPFDAYSDTGNTPHHHAGYSDSYTDESDYDSERVTTGNHGHYGYSQDKTTNEIPSSTTLPPSVSTHGQHDVYTTEGAWITHNSESPAKHSDNDVYTETTPSPFDAYSDTGNTPHHHAGYSDSYTDESDYDSERVTTGNHGHYGYSQDKTTNEIPSSTTLPPSVSTHGQHDVYTTEGAWITHNSESPAKHSDNDVYTETTPSPFDAYSDTGNTPHHHAGYSDSYTDESDYDSERVTTGNHGHYGYSQDKTTNEIPSSTTLPPSVSTHGQHDVYTTEGAWITHNSESPAKHSDNDVYTETTPSPFDAYSDTGNTPHHHAGYSDSYTDESDYDSERVTTGNHGHYGYSQDKTTNEIPSSTTLPPSVSTHGQHDVYTTEGAWITHNSESPAKHSDNDVYTETTPSPFDAYSDTGNTPHHHAGYSDSYTDESDYDSERVTTGNHGHYGYSQDKTTNEIPSSTTLPPSVSTHGQHDVYTTEGAWITHNSESPAKHSDNDVYTETTPSPFDAYSDTGYSAHGHAIASGTSGPYEDAEDYRDGEEAFPIQKTTGNPPLYDLGLSDEKDEKENGSDSESDSDSSDDEDDEDDYY
uniref:Uncharacterized protein n=1 Tax=Trichobilharzia regenti TaxID=157069 RepID=A0AA85JP21_TRIRE|nr:unnamed protein product [Trichobilharzia regenti]